MNNSVNKLTATILSVVMICNCYVCVSAFELEYSDQTNIVANHSNNRYFFDPIQYTHNTGKDNGFSRTDPIKVNDPHYGWQLGRFYIEGFTDIVTSNGEIIVLKNVGDKIRFGYQLEQDINCLNNDDTLSINSDDKTTDSILQVPKQDFGRGALFVKKTNYQGASHFPVEYVDFLSSCTVNAYRDITLYEEGDYSVALDYEIKDGRNIFGLTTIFGYSIFPSYTNYRYAFNFKIRNSNCMVYPMDAQTNCELYDGDRTINGFKLDLAKSRYLKLNIDFKHFVDGRPVPGGNKRASDHDVFCEEGIYSINVTNENTNRNTSITIFVGDSPEIITYARKYRGEPAEETSEDSSAVNTAPTQTPTVTNNDDTTSVEDTTEWLDSLQLNSPELQDYLQDAIYDDLVNDFNGEYYIEKIDSVFISKEYMEELQYNSEPNIFFGYTLDELDKEFGEEKYVFTLDENNQTTIEVLQSYGNTDPYDRMIENCIIGSGVILICVTVSAVTTTAAPAISVIFAVSADTASKLALSTALISGTVELLITGYESKDMDLALTSALLSSSEGFKWGSITGSISGAAEETLTLRGLMKGGLSWNEAAIIQRETHWPSDVISHFHSYDEYQIIKDAHLNQGQLAGKNVLIRDIDWNYIDNSGVSNAQRVLQGNSPIGPDGYSYELHHIGQSSDSPLAMLTRTEHRLGGNYRINHPFNDTSTATHDAKWEELVHDIWEDALKQQAPSLYDSLV